MDNPVGVWGLVLIALIVFGALFFWLNEAVSSARTMMRCPETGSITFVRAARVADGSRKGSGVRVVQCESWPGRKDCAQGCLARYHEATSGLRVNLDALRPFNQ
jgi:hypothetical protein